MKKLLILIIIINNAILPMHEFFKTEMIELIKNNISWKNFSCMLIGGTIKIFLDDNDNAEKENLLNEARKEVLENSLDKTILDIKENSENSEKSGINDKDSEKTLTYEEFISRYTIYKGSEEGSPISYKLKKKLLALNKWALIQCRSNSGLCSGFILNSIVYSLVYAPFYYFFIKYFTDYKKYNISSIHLIFLAEAMTILTKIMLKEYNKDRSEFWGNIDQKGISIIYCFLIGTAMHRLKR